jgi:hypothetical protein
MNSTNAHNLLPASTVLAGIDFVAKCPSRSIFEQAVYTVACGEHPPKGALLFGMALMLAGETAGFCSAADTTDMLDMLGGLL